MSHTQKVGYWGFALRSMLWIGLIITPIAVFAAIGWWTPMAWLAVIGVFVGTYLAIAKAMSMKYPPEGRRPMAVLPYDNDIPPSPSSFER